MACAPGWRVLLLTVVAVFGWACGAAAQQMPTSDGTPAVVGTSVEGRPIHCLVLGDGEDVFMLIATIHGNEASGTPLVAEFVRWLKANPEELNGRRVVIVPVANPDGMEANQRFNARGVDLNRNFPSGNWTNDQAKPHGETPLSEPESRVLMKLVAHFFPNRVVSIHQPLECVDYDGPAAGLAAAMAEACPLPVEKLGSREGSLGSFVGRYAGQTDHHAGTAQRRRHGPEGLVGHLRQRLWWPLCGTPGD